MDTPEERFRQRILGLIRFRIGCLNYQHQIKRVSAEVLNYSISQLEILYRLIEGLKGDDVED